MIIINESLLLKELNIFWKEAINHFSLNSFSLYENNDLCLEKYSLYQTDIFLQLCREIRQSCIGTYYFINNCYIINRI